MIIQGSSYPLEIVIKDTNGDYLDNNSVEEIEFCVGNLRKMYIKNPTSSNPSVVNYDATKKSYIIPLSERETLDMESTIQYQFRVKLTNQNILASIPEPIEVIESMSAVREFNR